MAWTQDSPVGYREQGHPTRTLSSERQLRSYPQLRVGGGCCFGQLTQSSVVLSRGILEWPGHQGPRSEPLLGFREQWSLASRGRRGCQASGGMSPAGHMVYPSERQWGELCMLTSQLRLLCSTSALPSLQCGTGLSWGTTPRAYPWKSSPGHPLLDTHPLGFPQIIGQLPPALQGKSWGPPSSPPATWPLAPPPLPCPTWLLGRPSGL